jgi:uncharacterized protein YmfQ (DUF2313 family)
MYPYPPPTNTPEDYLAQFQRLLPRGRVWHRGWGLVQDADLLTLMPTWARLQIALNRLIAEIFPCSTTGLLPEWEETLGLPDPCTGPLATTQQRRQAVCAKFSARGDQSLDYFIRLANSLGYDAIIVQFAPFRCGINTCGQPLYGEAWAYAWAIIVPTTATTIVPFTCGVSTCGDPLRTWGNKALECLLARYAPAHTIPIIRYALAESYWDSFDVPGGPSIWDDGTTVWDQEVIVDA